MRQGRLVVGVPDDESRPLLGSLPPVTELVQTDVPLAKIDLGRIEFLISQDVGLAPHLRLMTSLRVIQSLSAGVDWLAGQVPAGVHVYNAADVFEQALAEWVVASVLALEHGLPRAWRASLHRVWEPYVPGQLRGSRVVILGYGAIGRVVEKGLRPFGPRLTRIARVPRPGVYGVDDLDSILPLASILIVLLPLTPSTYRLLDRRRLGLLPRGALLVNAGRGRVIDTSALRDLAADGRLRAALDVVDPEPLPPNDPLWTLPDVLITPHIAGDSPDSKERTFRLAGAQLRRYAAGRPLRHPVASYLLDPFE